MSAGQGTPPPAKAGGNLISRLIYGGAGAAIGGGVSGILMNNVESLKNQTTWLPAVLAALGSVGALLLDHAMGGGKDAEKKS
jgi:hypothetical protein